MSDLQKRVREVLRNIVAEHELEAVLDSEISMARENLKGEVNRAAREFLREETKKHVDRWVKSEESEAVVEGLGKQLIENEKERWLSGDANSYNLGRVKEKIAKRLDEQVDSAVQSKLGWNGEYDTEIKAAANEAIEKYFPRAAALALEGLAIRALRTNLMKAEVSMGLSEGAPCSGNSYGCQNKVAPGKYCSECGQRQ